MDITEWNPQNSQRHPWEMARFSHFAAVLEAQAKPEGQCRTVLDIGGGDAWFAEKLLRIIPNIDTITCVDPKYTTEVVTKLRHAVDERVVLSAEKPRKRFDLVLLLDVLEHIQDDDAFLNAVVAENVHNDSYVLISVPAWNQLYSRHDARLAHFRRYAPKDIENLIRNTGLVPVQKGGLFYSLLLPRVLQKVAEKAFGREPSATGNWSHGPILTKAVGTALRFDTQISRVLSVANIELPGLSWWALCKPRRSAG